MKVKLMPIGSAKTLIAQGAISIAIVTIGLIITTITNTGSPGTYIGIGMIASAITVELK